MAEGTASTPGAVDVVVLGCGLMGSALSRAFATNGHTVAVWNRTHERAVALAGDRIRPVRSANEAVASAPLVVACLATYDATQSVLDTTRDWDGTTLVNLAAGAPDEAVVLENWAATVGAHYLDGSIVCYPQDIGSEEAAILYSGSEAAWTEHEQVLRTLAGMSVHVSERVTDASVLNVGVVGAFFVSALSAYVEAATYVLRQGVAVEILQALTQVTVESLQGATTEAAAAIVGDEHETDQATIQTYAEGAHAALAVMQGAGQQARLLAAATENLDSAAEAGLGSLGLSAQTRVAGLDLAAGV